MTDLGPDLRLRERMTDLVRSQDLGFGDASEDLRRGHRSLVARRLGAVAGAAAVVAVGTVAATTLALPGVSTPQVSGAPGDVLSHSAIIEECESLGTSILDDSHWSRGIHVLTASSSAGKARAVLVSGDGERWADCWLRSGDGTGAGWVATYPMQGDRPGPDFEYEPGQSGPDDGVYSFLERFPSDVASVSVRFDSGEVREVPAVDGFVALQLDDVEPGVNVDSIHLYDASGGLVAGPGMGPGDADLPPAYRTLVPRHPIATAGTVDGW